MVTVLLILERYFSTGIISYQHVGALIKSARNITNSFTALIKQNVFIFNLKHVIVSSAVSDDVFPAISMK